MKRATGNEYHQKGSMCWPLFVLDCVKCVVYALTSTWYINIMFGDGVFFFTLNLTLHGCLYDVCFY